MNEIASTKSLSGAPIEAEINVAAAKTDGLGCHAGKEKMREAAEAAGMSETLAQYAKDYPAGPHDQPQSMCPAFGSLRVGLRMRRTATVLSGSACCVYGLTFTSHFYGARRTVGYVPFNSETLVTGKLFEDIREAVFKLADPDKIRRRCHHQSYACRRPQACLFACCPRRSTGFASSESTFLALACRRTPRRKTCSPAPCCALRGSRRNKGRFRRRGSHAARSRPCRCWAKCSPPIPCKSAACSISWGWRRVPWFPPASGANSMARSIARRSLPYTRSTPLACASSKRLAGRSSAPRLSVTMAPRPGWNRSARPAASRARWWTAQKTSCCRRYAGALAQAPIEGRITLSGYEGSELLVGRLLVESGADLRYVGTACPRTRFSQDDCAWLEAKGVHVQYRASLEQDLAAMREFKPDLAIGTTPMVQKAKEPAIPALYFTNLISARPLMGVAGAGSLAKVINAALGNQTPLRRNESVSSTASARVTAAGVWEEVPRDRPEFRQEATRQGRA